MFATSTKTATFLLTMTPWVMDSPSRRDDAARRDRSLSATRGSGRGHDPMDVWTGFAEAHPLPACVGVRVVGPFGFDDGAALVAGRPDKFLQERLGDPVDVVRGIDDQEVDVADEPAGSNGRSECEDRGPDDDALRFGDDDARLREIDQLAHEIGRPERAVGTGQLGHAVTQRDDAVDVRDTGCSDQVFHATGPTSQG